MKNSDIVNLLKLRFAVYKAGCDKGLWPCLEDNAAKEYMNYLFPKSSQLAFYNLMINIVQKTMRILYLKICIAFSNVRYK